MTEFESIKRAAELTKDGVVITSSKGFRVTKQGGRVALSCSQMLYLYVQPSKTSYRIVKVLEKSTGLHRIVYSLAVGEIPEGMEIDHIDKDISNNRPCNLRLVTKSENAQNRGTRSDNKAGYRGVSFDKPTGKYRVEIKVDGVQIRLGRHFPLEKAIEVRKAAELKYHKYCGSGDLHISARKNTT